jgi:hypothetical protein
LRTYDHRLEVEDELFVDGLSAARNAFRAAEDEP